jgi:hypothetical protein
VVCHTQKEGELNMAKLVGAKKKAFVARMAKARKAAAAKKGGGKKKASKKKATKKKATKKRAVRKYTAAECGKRVGKKRASKKKSSRKSKRRCVPCDTSNLAVIRKRMGKHKVKNITCAIVTVGNSCRRICFSTSGKALTKSGAINTKAKRFLLSNQPAKGCGKKGGKRRVPAVVLRGLGF